MNPTFRHALLAMLILAAVPAAAQTPDPMHAHAAPAPAPETPATAAFKSANAAMMRDMDVPLTGNPDQDFVAGMLPHHQGAVAMARVELSYGKDPELRRLAQAIIAAQDREIVQMNAWRRRHPG